MSSLSCLPPSNSPCPTQTASVRPKRDRARSFVQVCCRCSYRGTLRAAPDAGTPAGSAGPPAEREDHRSRGGEEMKERRGCSGCTRRDKDAKNHRRFTFTVIRFHLVNQLLINSVQSNYKRRQMLHLLIFPLPQVLKYHVFNFYGNKTKIIP